MGQQYLFPQDFAWGAATASYQVEGAVKEDGRGESIWDHFCRQPGKIEDGSTGEIACDSYHRYQEDVALMKRMGLKAYRFSIAWPRVFPKGYGEVNEKGLDYYRGLIDELLANGIEPYVTIYHWDLPQTLQYEGGWANRKCAFDYVNYAKVLFEAFGDRVKHWFTFNEPWVSAILGYGLGQMAPGYCDYSMALLAAHHILVAHGMAVRLFREMKLPGEIGIVLNLSPRKPATDSKEDLEAAVRNDGNNNRWFLDALFKGTYPEDMKAWYCKKEIDLPAVQEGDMELITAPIDALGINYYTIYDPSVWPMEFSLTLLQLPYTNYRWAVTEEGITEILLRVMKEYGVDKVYIAENGASYLDVVNEKGEVNDDQRLDYLSRHIKACHKAMEQGVNLQGYFVWCFIDNFEWNSGFTNTMGIVHRDRVTCDRTIKKSGYWYAGVIAGHGIIE